MAPYPEVTGAEVANQLTAWDAIPEDLGLVSSIYMTVTAICDSSPRESNATFWPLQAPSTQVVYGYMYLHV